MKVEDKYLCYWNNYHREHKSVEFNMINSINDFLSKNNLYSHNLNVLEFGIGDAKNLVKLASIYDTVYACDVCDLAIKNAMQLNIKNTILVKNYFTELPLPSNHFDVIFISRTLSTISSINFLESTLNELKRISKENGYIIILDYCQSDKFLSSYSNCICKNQNISKLKPTWSSIPFLHFNEETIINLFLPFKKIDSFRIKISTCNYNSDDGIAIIFKNEK